MGKQHPCVAWVPILWGKCHRVLLTNSNKAKDCALPLVELSEVVDECVEAIKEEGPMIPYLPSDIMTNILLRLPAKCIFQLWQTNSSDLLYHLTTNAYFMRMYRCQATPTIVMQSLTKSVDNNNKLFLFDAKADNVEATSLDLSPCNTYCEGRPIDLWSSYDGFLLFRSRWRRPADNAHFCIWNPITEEQVIVTFPRSRFYVCGFYFHPRKKEHEVVCVGMVGWQCQWNFEFRIVSLKTKSGRSVGRGSYSPSRKRLPVFINGTLYWMVDSTWYVEGNISDSILSFNIETEEFSTMEAPVMPSYDSPQHGRRYLEDVLQLFELEGSLNLFDTSSDTEVVIWVLNNTTKRWDKKQSVTSPVQEHHWDFYSYFDEIEYIKMKGEFIAYRSEDKKLYMYNLRLGTWKSFETNGFQDDPVFITAIHTHSFVSLDAAADSVIPLQRCRRILINN